MVPILRLSPGDSYADPVPLGIPGRSSFRNTPALATRNIQDYYLSDAELTRAEYWGIVMQANALDPAAAGEWTELVHSADPLGRERLSVSGMTPLLFADDPDAWAKLLRDGASRPVTGVNFFQAYSAARMAGWLVSGDPRLLRLPLGVELEFAAMGNPRSERSALNGAAVARDMDAAGDLPCRGALLLDRRGDRGRNLEDLVDTLGDLLDHGGWLNGGSARSLIA